MDLADIFDIRPYPPHLSTKQAAAILAVHESALRGWRKSPPQHSVPPWFKHGGRYYYQTTAFIDWLPAYQPFRTIARQAMQQHRKAA